MNIKFNVKKTIRKDETIFLAKEVLFKSMLKMHELAVLNCPVDTGRLRSTINIFPMSKGFNEYILADGVDYGLDVEFGTSPHYIKPDILKGWARRKLGDGNLAYPISKKIAQVGTEAQPFFRPALDQVKDIWVSRFWESTLK